jgi:dolichol-phosphate mannosyltransferase
MDKIKMTDKLTIFAMLPTYNEAENIKSLMPEILDLGENYHVLVVDDNSPDGTWKIVENTAQNNDRVHLFHRKNEKGRGSAGIAGLAKCIELGADIVIEMDADYSHHPRYIPDLVKAVQSEAGADIAIGSRLIQGGGESGRSPFRKLVTHLANFYIRLVLGLSVKDCTSGFRAFRQNVLQTINLTAMESNGPAIVQEILLACKRKGFTFKEVPIHFEERRAGKSTFNTLIMLQGFYSVLKFRFRR